MKIQGLRAQATSVKSKATGTATFEHRNRSESGAAEKKFFMIWGIYALILFEASCFSTLFLLKTWRGVAYSPISGNLLSQTQIQVIRMLLDGQNEYYAHDPELGWSIKPTGSFAPLYRANSQGVRAERDYPQIPHPGVIRIATFGDSFTHGDEVEHEATWQAQLERVDPRLEIMNFGVGGYGIDQAYLRFVKEGAKYAPHVVIIGFMSENIVRSVNVFRPFYVRETRLPMAKPRFTLANGKLSLVPNPLPRLRDYQDLIDNPARTLAVLGQNDWFYRHQYRPGMLDFLSSIRLAKILMFKVFSADPIFRLSQQYNTESEAFRVTVALLARFYQEALACSSQPVIVLLPERRDIERTVRGFPPRYKPLVDALHDGNMRVLDVVKGFASEPRPLDTKRFFSPKGYHYSREGNRVVAQYLKERLGSILNEDNEATSHRKAE